MAWLDSDQASNIKARKPLPKQVMLKDYLLDDLSSCSSNGFQSYPRRQCCTTVRFLLEIDLNRTKRLPRSKSKAPSSTKSALHRASEAVVNAVKLLPFATAKSPTNQLNKPKRTILPRSFSRKLLKRSFWKKTSNEIQRWKSFRDLIEEEEKSSDFSPSFTTTTPNAGTTLTTTSTSTSNSISNSWSDSDFTSDYSQRSTENCDNSRNDAVGDDNCSPVKVVSARVSVTVGEDSVAATSATNSKNEWPKEEKEQFSPVSILDCPFDDDDDDDHEEAEEVSSPFKSRLARIQGTKQKLMQKIQRFEKLAELEPVDLDKQFSCSSELSDESPSSPLYPCSSPTTQCDEEEEEKEDEDKEERKALELLELVKTTYPSSSFKFQDDDLLLDFFKQRIRESYGCSSRAGTIIGQNLEEEQLNDAKDWMNGKPIEVYGDWAVPKNRQAYLTDMETGWRRFKNVDEEREEVAMELEVEVFSSLLDDLLLDLF